MKNWAEEYAEVVETRSEHRARSRRQQAQERAVQKALQERDYLYREWSKWHQKQIEQFLIGDYAEAAKELHAFLSDADLDSGDRLVELVKHGPWANADTETQYQVLRMINHTIVFLRESNGMPPFDDPLDDELNVFLKIRKHVNGW